MTDALILNDPVYGFINVPRGLLCRLIAHPLFQRLGRIRQLGMAPVVYPGAHHTRKQHSIGAFHLMQTALQTLGEKGHFIFESEVEAAEAAILLHDIGHGPFSHALEHELVAGVTHEDISRLMMEKLNRECNGELALAISIFNGTYPKPWLHDLVSSQLDMDRMDYLCRDSFYTGVIEGNIGAARIVKTLNIANDRLVIDAKGIYAVENYLMARRLMYWQVYLHKTAIGAEELFKAVLRRAKHLSLNGEKLFASPALAYFLQHEVGASDFTADGSVALSTYAALDDSDLTCAVKVWQEASDPVLSALASSFTNRRLFKVEACTPAETANRIDNIRQEVATELGISLADTDYFVTACRVKNEMYSAASEGIGILMPNGEVLDVSAVSNIVRHDAASTGDEKNYIVRLRRSGE